MLPYKDRIASGGGVAARSLNALLGPDRRITRWTASALHGRKP
jgi:hypothetical protein